MKKVLILIICFGMFTSCEEVVSVDLNEGQPKLVIDAKITQNIT